jgi:neocarzinostatin family protein
MRRFMTSIAIGTLILGGVTSLGLATVATAAGPSIQLTPSTALQGGTAVSVAGTGFQDNETLYALECINLGASTNETDCDTNTVAIATTSATGTFTTSVTVVTGTISATASPSTCGTSASDLTNCAIVVSTNPPSADAAIAPITFALPVATTTTTTIPPVNHGPRTLHVAPSTKLKNGSKVKVSGTGFKAGDHVYVVECLATSTSQAGCDLKTLKAVTISGSGVLHAFSFKVVTGKIGNGSCGTKASNLKSCAISVANASKGDSARVRISFK